MKLRNKGPRAIAALAAVCAVLTVSTPSYALDSAWSGGVGKILPNDDTVWCTYAVTSTNPYTIKATLQRRRSNGAIVAPNPYSDGGVTKLKAKMQCSHGVVGGSTPADNMTISCNAGAPAAKNVRCMLSSTDGNPFVYGYERYPIPASPAFPEPMGDPCSNGINSISVPPAVAPITRAGYRGQITGYRPGSDWNFLNFQPPALSPWNGPLMQPAEVHGTDMGTMFWAHNMLWSVYGDTWNNFFKVPSGPSGTRGNVVFQTFDRDASDGLGFAGYIGSGGPSTGYAREVIYSCHDSGGFCNEQTAIPSAGFGITDPADGKAYTFLWYLRIKQWNEWEGTIVSNGSNLAWHDQASGSPGLFARGDYVPQKGPQWGPNSTFGAGAIYQDRFNGYIYFIGQKPYVLSSPIRLARVKADFNSIMDPAQYWYWSGNPAQGGQGWVQGIEPSYNSTVPDLIPRGVNAGPEFSVIFNPWANRFLMLLVANRVPAPPNTTHVMQVYEAKSLTGPWTKKSADYTNLPHGQMTGGQFNPYRFFYAPYANELIMGGPAKEGKTVYYQLSEYNTFDWWPYNVGLWAFNVTPTATANCLP